MPQLATPIKFYSMHLSGNSHRVLLTLRALDLTFELIEVNLRAKEQKSEAFLKLNPFGQVPVIDDNGTVIWDSIGIMTYLALTYDDGKLLPRDPALFGQIMTWLGKTSGPIAYGIATARRINIFNATADIDSAHAIAHDFLNVMESHLEGRPWLVGEAVTLADLACYAYVAHAPEGGVDLRGFANVSGWLAQVEALPFYAAMPKTNVGLWPNKKSAATRGKRSSARLISGKKKCLSTKGPQEFRGLGGLFRGNPSRSPWLTVLYSRPKPAMTGPK